MRPGQVLLLPLPGLVACAVSCGDLAESPAHAKPARSSEPSLRFEPPAEEGRIAPIVHIHIGVDGPPESAGPPVLVAGSVSSSTMEDLQRGDVSDALRKRIRDTDWWVAGDGDIVVAARDPLDEGERYSLILPLLSWAQGLEVLESDALPRLVRLWPPDAGASSTRLVVWCVGGLAEGDVVSSPMPFALEPELVEGTLDFGAFPGIGRDCVRWEAYNPALHGDLVPPATLTLSDGSAARVAPGRITKTPDDAVEAGSCPDTMQAMGPVCFHVQDDRILVQTPQKPVLVSVKADERSWVAAVTTDIPMVVRPLAPESTLSGIVQVVKLDGSRTSVGFVVQMGSPMPHVAINEVMANPQGPEPQQEWVELINGGLTDVALGGWRIEDTAGSSVLPDVVLPRGGFALVVNESYALDSWVDRPPAPNTLIVRVESLGKAGIANGGEPLRLVAPDGLSASVVPAIESSSPGSSIARVRPEVPGTSAESFVFLTDGGTPGSPNSVAR